MPTALLDQATPNPYAVFPAVNQTDDCELDIRPIALEGELGLSQLLRANRLVRRSHLRRRPPVLMGLLLLSILGVGCGLWLGSPYISLWASFSTTVLAVAVFAVTATDGSTMLKLVFRLGLHKPQHFHCTISDSGVRTIFPRLAFDDSWKDLSGFTETDDLLLLWRQRNLYVPLPQEFVASDAEWHRLRDALHTRLPLRR
jgi:hypothetical protein